MPRPCAVCAHVERAEIDRRLSMQVCNLSELARTAGVPRKSLVAHRERHLPLFLPAFQASADALTLGELQGEARRLYMTTLDALARAEAGVLGKVKAKDSETGEEYWYETQVVSHTAIARMIREARAGLDQLTRLAADRPDEKGRPSNSGDAQLGEAIRLQLQRVIERNSSTVERSNAGTVSLDAIDATIVDVNSSNNGEDESGDGEASRTPTRGGLRAARASASALALPPDAVTAPKTPEGAPLELTAPPYEPTDPSSQPQDDDSTPILTEAQIRIAASAIGITPESFLHALKQRRTPTTKHPEWQGNPAATREERRAEGYEDVEVQDHRYE